MAIASLLGLFLSMVITFAFINTISASGAFLIFSSHEKAFANSRFILLAYAFTF